MSLSPEKIGKEFAMHLTQDNIEFEIDNNNGYELDIEGMENGVEYQFPTYFEDSEIDDMSKVGPLAKKVRKIVDLVKKLTQQITCIEIDEIIIQTEYTEYDGGDEHEGFLKAMRTINPGNGYLEHSSNGDGEWMVFGERARIIVDCTIPDDFDDTIENRDELKNMKSILDQITIASDAFAQEGLNFYDPIKFEL